MPPHDADHWREVAVKLRLEGKLAEAVDLLRRALERAPDDAQALSELAHALRWQGELDEACSAAEKAIELAPGLASAWFNLGAVQVAQGEAARGIGAYRKALELKPDFAEAWSNLGGALVEQGQLKEAIEAYRRALEVNPQLAPVWSNLGDALRSAREIDEAIAACRRAVEIDAGFAAGWTNLASVLCDDGQYEQAVAASERALALNRQLAEAWNNHGTGLAGLHRFNDAMRAHEQALALNPRCALFYLSLGATLEHSGRIEAAVAQYRRALEIQPDYVEARLSLAMALLTLGEFREGWEQYECRWQRHDAEPRRYDFLRWDGDTSRPGRLLLWSEQGVGDEIIYSGMLQDLAASQMDVTLECDPRFVPLFARSFPCITVVPKRVPPLLKPGDFDCQLPLASLGRWLRPSWSSFPRHSGYLRADPNRATAYRRRLLEGTGNATRIVGISWSSSNPRFGAFKSLGLADWSGLLAVPGARFLDLQYGDTRSERDAVERASQVRVEHFPDVDLFHDLEGLAALVAACDLVITVSNVTAHVAGALGRPVWILLPMARGKFWYWFSGRTDSPWYPSMRIFTQQTPGNWREVLDGVAQELAALVKGEAR